MNTVEHDVAAELRAPGLAYHRAAHRTGCHGGPAAPGKRGEVHERLRRTGHPVGLTTVHRTRHALAEAAPLHTFHLGGEDTYRHYRFGPHHHPICQTCAVIERPADQIAALLDRIRAEADFLPDPQQADLAGACVTCHTPTAATSKLEREPDR